MTQNPALRFLGKGYRATQQYLQAPKPLDNPDLGIDDQGVA